MAMSRLPLPIIANIVLFQLGWFVGVLLGSADAFAYTLVFLYIHVRFIVQGKQAWFSILVIALLGIGIDTALTWTGILPFDLWFNLLCPPWLILLWFMFATLVGHSLAWLERHLWLQPLLGAFGGGGSYLAGAKLIGLSLTLEQSVILVILWALLLPLFFVINRWVVQP